MSNRRGRKRQDGPRFPSGKLKPPPPGDYSSPAYIRRMLNVVRTKANDPLWGSELGRCRLWGHIDDEQCSAGLQYAELVARWHVIQGISLPFPPSASLQVGMGRSCSPDDDPRVIDRICTAYDRAREALRDAGKAAAKAVDNVAILDQRVVDLHHLKVGLWALHQHFQGRTRKSA